mmetsp:Transcript_4885/g.9520  ORF Transcript_4885/g.9520 Transcript_4885/m.9520 type:complete len:477 (+) Transcript_4885:2536-3966(+)
MPFIIGNVHYPAKLIIPAQSIQRISPQQFPRCVDFHQFPPQRFVPPLDRREPQLFRNVPEPARERHVRREVRGVPGDPRPHRRATVRGRRTVLSHRLERLRPKLVESHAPGEVVRSEPPAQLEERHGVPEQRRLALRRGQHPVQAHPAPAPSAIEIEQQTLELGHETQDRESPPTTQGVAVRRSQTFLQVGRTAPHQREGEVDRVPRRHREQKVFHQLHPNHLLGIPRREHLHVHVTKLRPEEFDRIHLPLIAQIQEEFQYGGEHVGIVPRADVRGVNAGIIFEGRRILPSFHGQSIFVQEFKRRAHVPGHLERFLLEADCFFRTTCRSRRLLLFAYGLVVDGGGSRLPRVQTRTLRSPRTFLETFEKIRRAPQPIHFQHTTQRIERIRPLTIRQELLTPDQFQQYPRWRWQIPISTLLLLPLQPVILPLQSVQHALPDLLPRHTYRRPIATFHLVQPSQIPHVSQYTLRNTAIVT